MNTQNLSRTATASGRITVTQPRRARATITLPPPLPRNRVAQALAKRSASSAAGRHMRSQGAQRRAERMVLQKTVRGIRSDGSD